MVILLLKLQAVLEHEGLGIKKLFGYLQKINVFKKA